MVSNVMFSSNTDLWSTPQNFFDRYNLVHSFDLDVCATAENAKCASYFSIETDGLSKKWYGSVWMNPPYGREISKWIEKAYLSVINGDCEKVVCLLPARTDTKWFHDYCLAGKMEFIKGRLKFGNATNSAPFPSVVVIFDKDLRNNVDIVRKKELLYIMSTKTDVNVSSLSIQELETLLQQDLPIIKNTDTKESILSKLDIPNLCGLTKANLIKLLKDLHDAK